MDRRNEIGRRSERRAEKQLKREGLVILARNWRGGGGEIDARDRKNPSRNDENNQPAASFRARHGGSLNSLPLRRVAKSGALRPQPPSVTECDLWPSHTGRQLVNVGAKAWCAYRSRRELGSRR